jgi:hypothetical protein
MITEYPGLPEGVAAFSATGEVTAEDYEKTLIPLVESKLTEHEKLRLFYYLGPEFKSFTAGAAWDDTKIGLKHLSRWEKVAMVTDVPWIKNTVKCLGFMMPAKVKVFPNEQLQDAKNWITN